jgi:hypothetical protein
VTVTDLATASPATPATGRERRRPERWLVPTMWLLVGAVLVTALIVTGSPALDVARWLGVVLVGVLLPGFVVVRAVRPGTAPLIEDLAWGAAAGCLVALGGWFLDVVLPWSPPPWVLGPAVVVLVLLVPGTRARVLARPAPGWGLGANGALAGTVLVVIGWMTADYLRFNPVDPGVAGRTYYPDTMFQLAVVGQLRHSLQPQYPLVHGLPFAYHWFLHAVLAHLLTGTGLDPFDVVLRLVGVTLLPVVLLLTAVVARRVAGTVRAGALAAVLLGVVGTTVATVWTTDGTSQAIVQTYWVASLTTEFGWLATVALTGCVVAVLRRGEADQAIPVWLLVPLTVLAAGAKSADLAVLLVGVAFAAGAALVIRRRVVPAVLVVAVVGISLLVAKFTIYSGTAYGLRWAPFAGIVARATAMFPGLTTPSGSTTFLAAPGVPRLVVAAVFGLWLLPLLPRLAGLVVLLRRRAGDPLVWLFLGTILAGFGATLAYRQPGSSEICFLFAAYPIGVVGSAWGLSLLPRLPLPGAAVGLLLTVAAAVVAGRVLRMPAGAGELHQIAVWAWPLGLVVVGLLVLVVVGRFRVFLVTAVLGTGLLSTGLYLTGTATALSYNQVQATTSTNLPTTRDDLTAGRWLASHSAPTDVLAVNRTCLQPASANACTAKDFTISALAGRDVDVGGWAYAPQNLDSAWHSPLWYASQPFWDQPRLTQELNAFSSPTIALLDGLRTEHGVRWLVADQGGRPANAAVLDTIAIRRLSLPTVTIWELRG